MHWTGERLETFVQNETTVEHLHRYALAMELAAGKNVLDIACGEGYGAHLLSAMALQVTGMDIDAPTIEKAKAKYQQANVRFETAAAGSIPSANYEYDLVISFETLEHLDDQVAVIKEIKRILKPGGLLVISTPDKKNYSDKTGYTNPFHKRELYKDEFEALLKSQFKQVQVYNQQIAHASFFSAAAATGLDRYTGDFEKIEKNKPAEPLYLIALASDVELPVLPNSLFTGNSIVEKALAEREKMVTSTFTYRLGHILLYPFKATRDFLKK